MIDTIPTPIFVGIALDYSETCYSRFGLYVYDGYWSHDYVEKEVDCLNTSSNTHVNFIKAEKKLNDVIIDFLNNYEQENHSKILMAGLVNSHCKSLRDLARRLWFELDILSLELDVQGLTLDEKACSAARKVNQWTCLSNIPGLCRVQVGYRHEVAVDANGRMPYCALEDYRKFYGRNTWKEIIKTSKMVKDKSKSIIFFNSTPQGGGVAILRHSTIRFCRLVGINARWFVMKPNPKIFEITKNKFHNVLQGIVRKGDRLSEKDKHIYSKWCEENVKNYWSGNDSPIYYANVIVFDDPQTAGIIPYIKKINPNATLVYRSHIEICSDLIAKDGSPQHEVWNYLWSFISHCDIFVSHPLEEFVPRNVKESKMKIKYMPATIDPCDGLNKKLNSYSLQYYQLLFNRIAFDQIRKKISLNERTYFVQIARFDPHKGISDLIDAYILFRNKISNQITENTKRTQNAVKIPQLVIAGHGSVDDPESEIIYKQILEKLNKISNLSQWVEDIIVVRLGPSDQILNAILSSAMIAFQLSLREGFEVKVSEALLKGIPVVAYKTGGIKLQIEDGKNGFLIEKGNVNSVCDVMYELTINLASLESLKKNAKIRKKEWILSPSNVLQWNKILLES